jgi:hypothetical protein
MAFTEDMTGGEPGTPDHRFLPPKLWTRSRARPAQYG